MSVMSFDTINDWGEGAKKAPKKAKAKSKN